MNSKKLYKDLLLLFSYFYLEVYSSDQQCKVFNGSLKVSIGHYYINKNCSICRCKENLNITCDIYADCSLLDCDVKFNDYANFCCEKQDCKNIRHLQVKHYKQRLNIPQNILNHSNLIILHNRIFSKNQECFRY